MEGRLVTVQGTVTALAEHSYSYTLALSDETGHNLGVYVDKNTHANPLEVLEVGQDAQLPVFWTSGTDIPIYPRQSDLCGVPPNCGDIRRRDVKPGETFT